MFLDSNLKLVISLGEVELEENLDGGAGLGFRVCQIIFKNVLLSK